MPYATRRLVVTGILLLGLRAKSFAELNWERSMIECKADVGAENVSTTVRFTNTGKKAVTILDIQTSCGCTTATLEKNSYQPGEGGQLRITLALRGLSGVQRKTIQVFTDDAPDRPTTLTLQTTLPEYIVLSPGQLVWTVGDAAEAKEALITISPAAPEMQVTAIRSDGTFFTATLRTDEAGKHLVVRPRTTLVPSQEVIFIDSQAPNGTSHTTAVVVRVR